MFERLRVRIHPKDIGSEVGSIALIATAEIIAIQLEFFVLGIVFPRGVIKILVFGIDLRA